MEIQQNTTNRQKTIHTKGHEYFRHYAAHKNGRLSISELARVCDISRTTAYKYKALLEA